VSSRHRSIHRIGPWALVALVVVFNLWVLRAETTPVPNLNDGSVHRSMIAWAEDRWSDGHLPLDGWYPQLALGSSRFHHYQSLPHVLGGLLAIPLGSDRAYSWTLYLGMALWPLAVYAGGRLFGLGRWRSAAAALVSPLIASAPTLGYEWGSYAWRGYGTWTQLWGMWLLPFAWGLGYRAVVRGRSMVWAALAVALTIAVHLLTGYLALLSLVAFALVRPTRLWDGARRAVLVGVGAVVVSAWVVVPLLLDRAYTVQDEFSRGKVFYDSFGARQILSWMFTGRLFDKNHLVAVVSMLAGLGLLRCLWRWRRDERARALVAVGLLSLLLFFGRSTLGDALRLLPGSGDLFLRRYVFGVHLVGIYLAGIAMATIGAFAVRRSRRWVRRPEPVLAALALVAVLVLAPAWTERRAWAAQGAEWIDEQVAIEATEGADVADLVAIAEARGPGRIYGGMRSNWGSTYKVGQVPVYIELLNQDAQAVGFTRPTWSLSSPAEYRFRDSDPALYDVFDVRYLLQPADREPPVTAELVAERGRHALWEVEVAGAIEVVDAGAPIEADRTDLGVGIAPWMRSDLPGFGVHPGIAFAGVEAPEPTVPDGELPPPPAGRVEASSVALGDGRASATVELERTAAVVLKASFDNRWTVMVDGEPAEPAMLAPSLVGVVVPAGRHEVAFDYAPFPRYDALLLVGAAALAASWLGASRRRPRATPVPAPEPVPSLGGERS
jgi:hypothetical protein